jgi:(R,R)-butanediol dehydrogenase/meso-butanediol dehydrogenase/diacetyl reductase
VKAAVTTGDHGFEVVDVPDLTPNRDELVIRVAACGVCGSDIKARPFAPAGMVMGHEIGGDIVAVGSGVHGWREGTNVAVLPVISCGTCHYCQAGVVSHCTQSQYIGMGPAGGFAEFVAVPARSAFALPDGMNSIYAALVEPFAVGLHGVGSAQITRGESILVVGAGGVGLTTVAWARAKGADRVTIADLDCDRRQYACTVGATDDVASVDDVEPDSYDAAVECVGHPQLLQACQRAVRRQGRIVISGACAEPTPIEPVAALLKELTIQFSVCYRPDEFREVIKAFADGVINAGRMIGPTFGLDRIDAAFEAVRIAQTQGRVLVTPGTPL